MLKEMANLNACIALCVVGLDGFLTEGFRLDRAAEIEVREVNSSPVDQSGRVHVCPWSLVIEEFISCRESNSFSVVFIKGSPTKKEYCKAVAQEIEVYLCLASRRFSYRRTWLAEMLTREVPSEMGYVRV